MSLYIIPAGASAARLAMVSRELAHPAEQVVSEPGEAGFVWSGRDAERFGPAHDPRTGVRAAISGRLSWSALEWARAARLPYEGGLAARLVLERFLERGPGAVAPYNGAALVSVFDPRSGKLHLWTDQFGYHPCFLYRAEAPEALIVTTFPDALLADPETELSFDAASAAEFVRAWRVTPPNTYFREVKHAGAAQHIVIDARPRAVSRTLYWAPFEDGFYPSIGAAGEALAAAVGAAIAERTAVARRTAIFLSGGADSRVMAFSAADPGKLVGLHIFGRESAEKQIAAELCAVAGCQFRALRRDNDFYPRNLSDIVRWSGAMWSAEDAHYPGFAAEVADTGADLVMTACTADWLFKGYGLEKRYAPLFGRNLPFLQYAHQRVAGFLPNMPAPAPPELAEEVDARLAAWFDGCPDRLASPEDRLMVEDRRIRPTCYTVSVSGQVMYRVFPYDTFFADSRIAECYSRIHPDWRLNREVWGRAAARLCAGAGRIVDANYGWRVDAGMAEKAAMFAAGWVGRRVRARASPPEQDDGAPPQHGSWPDLGWYAERSQRLRDLWESVSAEERERMAFVTGTDHWARPLEAFRHDGHHLFRIVTLLSHWRGAAERVGRPADAPEPARPEVGAAQVAGARA